MIRAGSMDRRIALRHRALASSDPNGQQKPSWPTTYATVWARKIEVSGREFVQAQTTDAQSTVRFEIRYRDDVVATDQVICDGKTYQLIAPPSEIGRREGLTLFAQAVVNG
jgi:SPP1 family predicted phage head-tail adaptor